jgi:DNA-binding NtrC family response regulator
MERPSSPLVLLLEDEAIIAIDVETALKRSGFSVVMFASCRQAEDWLEDNSPQIAVLDVALADGVCVNVAATLIERRIPFIVHSGYTDLQACKDTVFKAGTWMGKPAHRDDLVANALKLAGLSAAD